jgi:MFS family permease
VVPFNNIHAELFASRYFKGEETLAAQVMSLPDTLSAILIPPLGALVDKIGRRAHFLFLCSMILAIVHLILMATPTDSSKISSFQVYPLLFLLGIAYAISAILYTCIPLVLSSPSQIGIAYGISTTSWNLASFIYPIIVAELASKDSSFKSTEFFFVVNSCIAIMVLVYLEMWDEKWNNGRLARPQKPLKRTDSDEAYQFMDDSNGVELEEL